MKKKMRLCLTFLTSCMLLNGVGLVSCQTTIPDDQSTPKEEDGLKIVEKNSLDELYRGMTVDLTEYIDVVNVKDGKKESVSFKSSVIKGSSDTTVGSIDSSGKLVLSKPGKLVLDIEANGEDLFLEINVKEANELTQAFGLFNKASANYKINYYDASGNKTKEVLRSKYYMYDSTNNSGYVLSQGDDLIYLFSIENNEVKEQVPPQGEKGDFNNAFVDLSTFASSSYWTYTSLTKKEAQYKKYKYALTYSTTALSRLLRSLYITSTTLTYNSSSYSLYTLLMCVSNGELSFLPVYTNSSYSVLVYGDEIKVNGFGEAKNEVLDAYIADYKEPVKVDTSEIVTNLKYCTSVLNYSIDYSSKVYDEEGNKIKTTSSVFRKYFSSYGYTKLRKLNSDIFWHSNFSGMDSQGTVIPGGLINKNNKTYLYRDLNNTGEYTLINEYIESGKSASYSHYYMYSNIEDYIPTIAFSTSDIKNGYPTYDEDTKTYTYSNTLTAGQSVVTGALSMIYQPYAATSGNIGQICKSTTSTASFNFTYDENNTLSNVKLTVKILFTPTLYSDLDQTYTLVMTGNIFDIGSTDLSDVKAQLESQF